MTYKNVIKELLINGEDHNYTSYHKDRIWFLLTMGFVVAVFVILKKLGVIDWSWFWIVAPVTFPIAVSVFFFFVLWCSEITD